MEARILKAIYESLDKGEIVALATITDMKGSTPRDKGSIMAVWADGTIKGSVGGGMIEHSVIQKSIECIKTGIDQEFKFELTSDSELHMQCGGKATVYVKIFKPRPKLLIVGGGHVGLELFKVSRTLEFNTVIFDDREEFANEERFQGADEIIVGDMQQEISKYNITSNTYIIIVTRGHESDAETLKEVANSKAAYIGMIGSKKKTKYVMDKLMNEGITKEALKKVYAPVGLNISSEEPREIAFGILSEMLLLKNNGSLQHLRDVKKVEF